MNYQSYKGALEAALREEKASLMKPVENGTVEERDAYALRMGKLQMLKRVFDVIDETWREYVKK